MWCGGGGGGGRDSSNWGDWCAGPGDNLTCTGPRVPDTHMRQGRDGAASLPSAQRQPARSPRRAKAVPGDPPSSVPARASGPCPRPATERREEPLSMAAFAAQARIALYGEPPFHVPRPELHDNVVTC